jgi:hypothetical protein
MTVNEFKTTAGLSALCLPEPDREIRGGYVGDLLSWVMGRAKADDAWITIMSNQNILAVASLADVACIVLAEGVKLEEDVLATARDKGINVLCGEGDAFSIAAALASELL